MASRGVFYAITPTEAEHLLSLVGNDTALVNEVLAYFSDERRKAHLIAPIDKSWDVMHRCLTDGTLRSLGNGATPHSWCILGGRNLHQGKSNIICYIEPEKVPLVAEAIGIIEPQTLYQKYWAMENTGVSIPLSREDFEYTWDYFMDVRGLYSRAAADNRAIVFMTD